MSMRKREASQRSRPPTHIGIAATVSAVITAVKPGQQPYAVAYPHDDIPSSELTRSTSITFTLLKAWTGDGQPDCGQIVTLDRVEKFARGWRAAIASPVTANQQ